MQLIGFAVILALSIRLGPLATEAQRTAQVYRVGVVFVGEATPADDTPDGPRTDARLSGSASRPRLRADQVIEQ